MPKPKNADCSRPMIAFLRLFSHGSPLEILAFRPSSTVVTTWETTGNKILTDLAVINVFADGVVEQSTVQHPHLFQFELTNGFQLRPGQAAIVADLFANRLQQLVLNDPDIAAIECFTPEDPRTYKFESIRNDRLLENSFGKTRRAGHAATWNGLPVTSTRLDRFD